MQWMMVNTETHSGSKAGVSAATMASRGTISGKQEGSVVQHESVAALGLVGSINWQTHDKGLGEDPVWSQLQRQFKDHQAINHICSLPSVQIIGYAPLPLKGQPCMLDIPCSPVAYL